MKNKSIALLVGILIIISLASFLIVPRSIVYLTGKASSGSSNTAFNLTSEVSVLVTNAVDFGEGRVDANATFAILDSSLGTGGSSIFGWFNVTGITGDKPLQGFNEFVAYDSQRDVSIFYGGDVGGDLSNETWQFNYSSKQWTNLTDLSSVPQQTLTSMVYDSSIGAVILFGGFPGNVGSCYAFCASNETWKFNSSQKWEKLSPLGESPPPVQWPSMAFDSKRNVTVLFGGIDSGYDSNETWEYNASSNTWENKSNDVRPPPREIVPIAFDSNRNVTVIFGWTGDYVFADTWEYDGTDWVNISTAHSPLPRQNAGMTYDSVRKKVVLAGGSDENGTSLNDTWEYDGTDWTDTGYALNGARYTEFRVVFDTQIGRTLLFYGNGESSFDDVQEYGNITAGGGGGGGCINGTWSFSPSFIYVENDGTVDINVNYTANKNAGQFIGGTSPSFKIKGVVDESGACADLNTTYADVPNSTETPLTLCPLLKYQNDADRIKVPARLVVPSDVASGMHNSTITLTATQV